MNDTKQKFQVEIETGEKITIQEDLERRDITINAIAKDVDNDNGTVDILALYFEKDEEGSEK